MSLRLKLYTLGARWMLKPLLTLSDDPVRDAEKLDTFAARFNQYRPYSTRLNRPLGGRDALWVRGRRATSDGIILYFHGGGYFAGSPQSHGPLAARLSEFAGFEAVLPHYRRSSEAPFPAAYEDAVAAWDDLLARGYEPDRIVLAGDSAGGGLALALLAELCHRNTPPAGLIAMSPWTDLTLSGASMTDEGTRDPIIPADRAHEAVDLYLKDADPQDWRASPLFATFENPPPVLLQIGSPEALADDTYRMAEKLRAAGGDVQVETWDGAPHVWHLGEYWVPEARDALKVCGSFVHSCFASGSR